MARRQHDMPFGAATGADGSTRFRLWAPAASGVELVLSGPSGPADLVMGPREGGWFELTVPDIGAGARYAYRIDGGLVVPDPASRCNPDDVHAASMVVDPAAFVWEDDGWRGRPWTEAVIYELHVGTFTAAGNFAGVAERLDHLAELGITAIELMPVAEFPGRRNWGYDGVMPFAPDAAYGTPEGLKQLVQSAHARRIMVLLDVVYNHFGPEGNYLHVYAPQFFDARRQTPWGAAIDFDGAHARTVRDFFIHNALYWLEEYHLDGLRLDAIHAIVDESQPDIVAEIARAVRDGPGGGRHVHLVLENDNNQARYLGRDETGRPLLATAQWNDDVHHAFHILLTGERDGYYADYADRPLWYLGRCLAEGFGYQGEASRYRDGAARGESSVHLPAAAFVNFLQTHDQVGNRAFGERIGALAPAAAVDAALACLLLSPAPPMLFMGEEFDASAPFLYFCDFGAELARAVTNGRRDEFGRFARFRDPAVRDAIPDPNDPATARRSTLDWRETACSLHRERLALCRRLLALRRQFIAPRLGGARPSGTFDCMSAHLLAVRWTLDVDSHLHLLANLGPEPVRRSRPPGRAVYASDPAPAGRGSEDELAPWAVVWTLENAHG